MMSPWIFYKLFASATHGNIIHNSVQLLFLLFVRLSMPLLFFLLTDCYAPQKPIDGWFIFHWKNNLCWMLLRYQKMKFDPNRILAFVLPPPEYNVYNVLQIISPKVVDCANIMGEWFSHYDRRRCLISIYPSFREVQKSSQCGYGNVLFFFFSTRVKIPMKTRLNICISSSYNTQRSQLTLTLCVMCDISILWFMFR